MPIPKPGQNEEQAAFISRCMVAIAGDESDDKVRAAICYDSWRRSRGISASEAIEAQFASRAVTVAPYDWRAASDEFGEDGKIARRFVKGVIRVGTFHKASEQKTFVVTPATLTYWSETFRTMKDRGVKVWIPRSHEDAHVSDHNRGWVDDLFVVDDTLFMSCRLIGKDAIAAAPRNDVSIHCPATWTDDGGNKYIMPIRHIALCPDPVVSGLSNFVEVELSERKGTMSVKWWDAIAKALDLSDVNEENAIHSVLAAIKGLKTKAKASLSSEEDGTSVDEKKGLKDLTKEKKEKAGEEKSVEVKFSFSPIQLSAIASARRAQVNALLMANKVTADIAKKLVAKYVGNEQADKLALTLSGNSNDDFDEVLALFDANRPVELAELTRAQYGPDMMVLSNSAADNSANPLLANAKARAEAAAK